MQYRASVERQQIRAELGFQHLAAVYLRSLIRSAATFARGAMQQLSIEGMADLRRSINHCVLARDLNRLTDAAAMGRGRSRHAAQREVAGAVAHPGAGSELYAHKPALLDELLVAAGRHREGGNAVRQFHWNFHTHRLAVLHYSSLLHRYERGVLRSQAMLQADLDDLGFVFGVALLYPAPILSHQRFYFIARPDLLECRVVRVHGRKIHGHRASERSTRLIPFDHDIAGGRLRETPGDDDWFRREQVSDLLGIDIRDRKPVPIDGDVHQHR